MMARQRKSGSRPKRKKEYTGGGNWGPRFSQRELEREINERLHESQGLADTLEPERGHDGGRSLLRWVLFAVLLWVVSGAFYAAFR